MNYFSPDVKRDGDILSVYTDTAIKATSNCSLTRGGFLLIAVLSGGDYDQVRHELNWYDPYE